MRTHLLKPNRMNNNWSSKQVLKKKDLVSLQKDLLVLCTKLQEKDSNTMDYMMNMTYKDLTRMYNTKNILESILINLENE